MFSKDKPFVTTSLLVHQQWPNTTFPVVCYETMVAPNQRIFYKLAGPKYNSKANIVGEYVYFNISDKVAKRHSKFQGVVMTVISKLVCTGGFINSPKIISHVEYNTIYMIMTAHFNRKGILVIDELTEYNKIQPKNLKASGIGPFGEAEYSVKKLVMEEVYRMVSVWDNE